MAQNDEPTMWIPSTSTFLLSRNRMNAGRRSGAAFTYSSSGAGVFCSRLVRGASQTGPKAPPATPCGRPMSWVQSALFVVTTPRPVMVTFSTFVPPSIRLQTTGVNSGEGPTFLRLTIDEEWQATAAGNVLKWNLNVATNDDARTAFVTTTYTGQVLATGVDQPTAFASALAQAQALGNGMLPFQLRSAVTENEKLFQTTGAMVFVTVDFSYEKFDKFVVGTIVSHFESSKEEFRILVLSDHATPVAMKTHARDRVCFAMYGTDIEHGNIKHFNEKEARLSKFRIDKGHELMEFFIR